MSNLSDKNSPLTTFAVCSVSDYQLQTVLGEDILFTIQISTVYYELQHYLELLNIILSCIKHPGICGVLCYIVSGRDLKTCVCDQATGVLLTV